MIYTVGHSNHAIERFIALLAQHEIRRRALEAGELGARSDDPACYADGRFPMAVSLRRRVFDAGWNACERWRTSLALR